MPRIALDARKYHDFGIGTYIRHLIGEYAVQRPSGDFFLFVAPEDEKTITIPGGWKSAVVRYGKYSLSEMFLFGKKVRANGVSVFHSPHYTLPFVLASRSVVTIHDLIHLRFPQFFSPLHRAYSYGMIRHAISASQSVITDSEFTKQDILRTFRVAEEKITPIHLGVSHEFCRKSPAEVNDFRSRFGLERPYILFVGNTKPHKGLEVLLRAFKEIILLNADIDLAFAGGNIQQNENLRVLLSDPVFRGKVKSIGRLSDKDLVFGYNGAEMLVLPSLYEGFGLPALEAMACGTPVIVSDAGSFPEVVGDGAIVCEKGNAGSFADAMMALLQDRQLRTSMIQKGTARAKAFSWGETARKTLEVYDRIL